jgi:transcriptional regulator with XRE-family HTH domain
MTQGKRDSANPVTMGGRLQRVRVEMGLSLRDIASQTGVAMTTIRDIEQSHAYGKWRDLVAIARALDVSLYYVFGEREGYGMFGE